VPAPKSRRWTAEEQQTLRHLAARGVPLSEIAQTLERSRTAVRTKAAHARLPLNDAHTSGPRRLGHRWERK
jgi:DNA-directed RNA polymerase specialized sigma24 family protein